MYFCVGVYYNGVMTILRLKSIGLVYDFDL